MFSTVLALRLAEHGVGLVAIGFFAWITLLPTVKFLWAPLIDRYPAPGFGRFWGKRRGWLMLSQLGMVGSLVAMALTSSDESLPVTALWATLLAFWTTTLEIAADGWRIELAPAQADQGPIVAANQWGYRSAFVAASSGALIIADAVGWTAAYLSVAFVALLPFPMLVALRPEPDATGSRGAALLAGMAWGALILAASTALVAGLGSIVLGLAARAGINAGSNVTPVVLVLCMLPFLAMALALPRIHRAPPSSRLRASPAVGPYVDVFWRYGYATLLILVFASLYRMGDVLALTLSKPFVKSLGYSLTQIGVADGAVALLSALAGVAAGGYIVTRWPQGWTLALGAAAAAVGNWAFAWLGTMGGGTMPLYVATGLDQFGNGMAGAVFVVYLSLLVNPRFAGAQYAFLSSFAFLLPRLLAGASGSMQEVVGYDGFFLLAGALSLASVLFLPVIGRLRPRPPDDA